MLTALPGPGALDLAKRGWGGTLLDCQDEDEMGDTSGARSLTVDTGETDPVVAAPRYSVSRVR